MHEEGSAAAAAADDGSVGWCLPPSCPLAAAVAEAETAVPSTALPAVALTTVACPAACAEEGTARTDAAVTAPPPPHISSWADEGTCSEGGAIVALSATPMHVPESGAGADAGTTTAPAAASSKRVFAATSARSGRGWGKRGGGGTEATASGAGAVLKS